MLQRFKVVVILTASFLATGSQWNVLQVFAWASMFSENVRQLPLGEAVARTFSPEARCNLCAAVSEGKQQQQSETALNPKFEDRSLLICEPAPQYLFEADDVAGWLDSRTRLAGISRERPPVPPPRV